MRSLIGMLLFPALVAGGCGNGNGNGGNDLQAAPVDLATGDLAVTPPDLAMSADMAGGAMPNCADYCNVIATHCNAGNNELAVTYVDTNQCMAWCTKNYGWAAGPGNATSGNNIGCRTYHANAAMSNPTLHCPHAGPSGANVCGSWCDNYCYLALRNCTGPLALYPDLPTCMTACAKLPASGVPNATSGNTVQCRIYHLGVAGTDATSAKTHCPHGSSTPTGPCM